MGIWYPFYIKPLFNPGVTWRKRWTELPPKNFISPALPFWGWRRPGRTLWPPKGGEKWALSSVPPGWGLRAARTAVLWTPLHPQLQAESHKDHVFGHLTGAVPTRHPWKWKLPFESHWTLRMRKNLLEDTERFRPCKILNKSDQVSSVFNADVNHPTLRKHRDSCNCLRSIEQPQKTSMTVRI